MSRPAAPAVLCALLALFAAGVVGCGGSEGDVSVPSTSASPAGDGKANAGGAGGGSREGGSGQGGAAAEGSAGGSGVDLRVRPESIEAARVTETGAVQTLPPSEQARQTAQKNTYRSIGTFGNEAEGPEATNITYGLVQYLDAMARGDWATACARVYSVLRESLTGPDGEGDCARALSQLMGRVARARRVDRAMIDVSSVRRGDGNRAFVIYKTPGTLSADMPMYVEDGIWKVGALEAYVLESEQIE